MQPVPDDVVVCWVVVGGGGGGVVCVAVWVVVWVVVAGGGGGGGVVCVVVVVGGGAVVAVWTVAGALCAAGFACGCRFGLAALAVVVVVGVDGVDWVVEVGVVAATLWLEVDEAEPQALTTSVSSTAPSGMRRCLIGVSLAPRNLVACLQGRRPPWVASRI